MRMIRSSLYRLFLLGLVVLAAVLSFSGPTPCPLRAGAEEAEPNGCRVHGIREGQVLIKVERPDVLALSLQVAYGWMKDANVFGPDGRRIALVHLTKEEPQRVPLDKGPGTYRVSCGGVAVWEARTEHSPLLFVPDRDITCIQHSYESFSPFYFRVPPDTKMATLCFTNQRGTTGPEAHVRLTAPDGTELFLRKLEELTPRSFMERIGATNEREAEMNYEILT